MLPRVTAITPGPASRESILAALRAAAITLEAPYGPPGGLPGEIRIDRGKDFLSKTVTAVMAGFVVTVGPLPPYTPHLKGTVETLNGGMYWSMYAQIT
jgi:putative transposase